jgi:glycosyltransferase involved in cell wall biosynthesis
MKNIKLTIGIPTWNRRKYLERLVDNTLNQIKKFNFNDIEILISDNASDDGTFELYKKKYAKEKKIRYHRNKINLKCKGNILKIIEKARGEFIWFLGDDDLIIKDKLPQIMNLISERKKIFLLNSISKDGKSFSFYKGLKEGSYNISINDSMFKRYLTSMGLLSNIIIPATYSKKIIKKYPKFSDIWPHLHIAILASIENNINFYLFNHAITDNTKNNNLVYTNIDHLKIFVEGYYDLIDTIEKQTGKNLSKLKYSGVSIEVFGESYIATTFSGNYRENMLYVFKLNKKVHSIKILFLSIPFIIPRFIRKFLFFITCVITRNKSLYDNKKESMQTYINSKSIRSVTSPDNYNQE